MAGVVIIGAGQAAAQIAASLRQERFEGPITILGEESELPLPAPTAFKGLFMGKIGVEKTLVRPAEFYGSKNIAVNLDTKVLEIDPEKDSIDRIVRKYAYDDLVIATGSRARESKNSGIDLDGIHYLRSLKDVNSIKNQMKTAKRLCIVGGGYIGLEVAVLPVSSA